MEAINLYFSSGKTFQNKQLFQISTLKHFSFFAEVFGPISGSKTREKQNDKNTYELAEHWLIFLSNKSIVCWVSDRLNMTIAEGGKEHQFFFLSLVLKIR